MSADTGVPFSLSAYRSAMGALAPVANLVLERRLKAGKEDPDRIGERRGIPSCPRPEGRLLWVHGASVGESLSVLPLIERVRSLYPTLNILVTTGTVTSANLMAERLPQGAFHQYVPVDQPVFVQQFLDHWRPDGAIFIESELWPVTLGQIQDRSVPIALVNGRLSPRSFKGWQRRSKAAHNLLSTFKVIVGQDDQNAERLGNLAGREVLSLGNLKRAAQPLPLDEDALATLKTAVGDRPVWLAASTHPGEEPLILDAHEQMIPSSPNILTVIAPRHPQRGQEIRELAEARGIEVAQRSKGETITGDKGVYVADTLGELGIFYRLSDVAFIGGSLKEVGGHNPMEPARLGTAIVTGPHVFNFAETFKAMRYAGGLALVRNERDLSASLLRLLGDVRTRAEMAAKAQTWADEGGERVLTKIVEAIRPVLDGAAGHTP